MRFFSQYGIPTLMTAVIAYLIGSVSFSIIVTRNYHRKDIRSMGSGNAGATNVLRSVGKVPAVLTTLGDFGKTILAIVIGRFIFENWSYFVHSPAVVVRYGAYIAGFCCFLGHLYPLYFRFKGGKGVLTAAAMMLLIDWRVFLVNVIVFAVLFACTRIISVGSIVCASLYPVFTWAVTYFLDRRTHPEVFTLNYVIITTAITTLIGLMVVIKHYDNLKRLFSGREKPIVAKE